MDNFGYYEGELADNAAHVDYEERYSDDKYHGCPICMNYDEIMSDKVKCICAESAEIQP